MSKIKLSNDFVRNAVKLALNEDLYPLGDITSSLVKNNKNIKLIVAVIGSIDSKGSLKLHEKLGFKKTGVLKKIGFKNNKWIDSILLQKNL